ncbi:MAG: hypothetical protein ABSA71_13725 [Desulfomonilia bacterium]|jgi:hypothetical protein
MAVDAYHEPLLIFVRQYECHEDYPFKLIVLAIRALQGTFPMGGIVPHHGDFYPRGRTMKIMTDTPFDTL